LNISYELDRVVNQKYRLIVLDPIFSELKKLHTKGNPKVQMESRVAVDFVKTHCEQWPSEYQHKNTDFVLLHYGEKTQGIIATNDRHLRKLARKKKIKTLYIRNKRILDMQ